MNDGFFLKPLVTSDEVIAASESYTTSSVVFGPLSRGKGENNQGGNHGANSISVRLEGDGELKIEAMCSGDEGSNFDTISPAIVEGLLEGYRVLEVSIPLCTDVKFKLTETGGSDRVTIKDVRLLTR